ncbi:MAG: type II toxin-antitoxin system PemK/MazF family toxin [Candidatus Babeliales bacterium]|nr:type II toxin-antitoxin system PemK/MazF family toxin [Candidatus Babeliales bacterium]
MKNQISTLMFLSVSLLFFYSNSDNSKEVIKQISEISLNSILLSNSSENLIIVTNDNKIRFFSFSGNELAPKLDVAENVTAISYSETFNKTAIGMENGNIYIVIGSKFNRLPAEPINFKVINAPITSLYWGPDGNSLVFGAGNRIGIYNPQEDEEFPELGSPIATPKRSGASSLGSSSGCSWNFRPGSVSPSDLSREFSKSSAIELGRVASSPSSFSSSSFSSSSYSSKPPSPIRNTPVKGLKKCGSISEIKYNDFITLSKPMNEINQSVMWVDNKIIAFNKKELLMWDNYEDIDKDPNREIEFPQAIDITYLKNNNEIKYIGISKNGDILFSGEDIKKWGKIGNHKNVIKMALSPDENNLATGSADGTIKVWNLKDKTETNIFDIRTYNHQNKSYASVGPVKNLLWLNDNKLAYSLSNKIIITELSIPKTGEVYWLSPDISDPKSRPAVIISSEKVNKEKPYVIVATATTTEANGQKVNLNSRLQPYEIGVLELTPSIYSKLQLNRIKSISKLQLKQNVLNISLDDKQKLNTIPLGLKYELDIN